MESYSQEIRRVAAAVNNSARFTSVLGEAWRFAQRLNASLTLIHAGEHDAEMEQQFREALVQLGIPRETRIVQNEGEPAEAIVKAAQGEGIDLLIAAALEGEDICDRSFLGVVARPLAHQARLSLLLLTHPQIESSRFRKIAVITDFSECAKTAFNNALWLAGNDAAEFVYVISIYTAFMQARAEAGGDPGKPARTRDEEEHLMRDFLAMGEESGVRVRSKIVDATTGFAACDFVNAIGADLLVVPAHDGTEAGVAPMADWALQVIPCSLWIVRRNSPAASTIHANPSEPFKAAPAA